MNCPRCRKKLEYEPEHARKGKPSHFWCTRCQAEIELRIRVRSR